MWQFFFNRTEDLSADLSVFRTAYLDVAAWFRTSWLSVFLFLNYLKLLYFRYSVNVNGVSLDSTKNLPDEMKENSPV